MAVVHPQSGKWYRAIVTRMEEKGSVSVRLVDVGTTLTVSWGSVHYLEEQFAQLAPQAVKVRMAGVAPPAYGVWPSKAVKFFARLVEAMIPLTATAKGEDGDGTFPVVFYEGNVCLNLDLVTKGLAASTGDM